MRRALVCFLIALVPLSHASAGPRLTSRDAGLYVGVAGEYMFGPVPFAFSIDQVGRKSDPVWLTKMIERLHANGKRSILDIFLYENGNEQAKPAAEYMAWLDPLLAQLPLDKVYAITLSEENIYWNGHAEMLTELYRLVKAKHPTLAVYQWYSPGAGVPGFGPWPLLPADGWIIDEYCRPREPFEKMVKQYTLLDKPLIHIAWAAPGWKEFSTWDQVWDDQLEICRRYGVPVAFFCWWPPDSTPPPPGNQSMWSWSAPPGTEHHRVWNQQVLPVVARLAKSLPAPQDANRSSGQPLPVAGDEQGRFLYHEDFTTAPRFVDDADIAGFTGLRWTGDRLQIKPGQAATLTYRLESPFTMRDLAAAVKCDGPDTAITLSLSADGKKWTTRSSVDNAARVALAERAGLRKAWVRVELSGKRERPAALTDLTITANVDPPQVAAIALTPLADGAVRFTDAFGSQLYLHAGKVTKAAEIQWRPGALGMCGKQGLVNEATVDYHFVCARPLREVTVRLACSADKANMGATVELASSLDGQTFAPLVSSDAEGRPAFQGELQLRPDLGGGAKSLWVRLTLRNSCGATTLTANPTVTRLTLEGKAAQ